MADSKKYDGSQWEHSLRKLGTATETIQSGDTIYANGQPITTYTLKGNEEHTGTPSPQNPVMPNGVGNKTANLWSEEYTGISANPTYVPIYVGDGQFTLSTTTPFSGQAANLFFLAGNVASGASTGVNGVWDGVSRTVTAIDGYVTICYRNATSNPEYFKTMLNTGSTAKPYEPYGYKIPISSGGVTTNIYLGSTQTTRQIKKLVLDGTENWQGADNTASKYLDSIVDYKLESGITCMSTHYSGTNNIVSGDNIPNNSACFYNAERPRLLYLKGSEPITLSDFKAYLATQYANGTPVTIWYVLATPQTATVNEPLMKIGTYYDSISNAVAIPTAEGANSITVDTTVQPSEFTATWTGWHDASVKEYDGSDWQ